MTSAFMKRRIEQQGLLFVGRLKDRRPLFKVSPRHWRSGPFTRQVATFRSLYQLLQGRIDVVELDSHPQGSGPEAFLITLGSRPVAPLQNHTLAPGEKVQRQRPQPNFETDSKMFIPQIGAQVRGPLVLVQPNGGDFGCEPSRQRRLARGREPADQDEPRPGPSTTVVSPDGAHGERLRALNPHPRPQRRSFHARPWLVALPRGM
jgi:hypothetical protein